MDEVLNYVYDVLKKDAFIQSNFENRIYWYEPSENDEVDKAFIIIDPLKPFDTMHYASNTFNSKYFYIQINIETYDWALAHQTLSNISELLCNHSLVPQNDGFDDYFEDTKRYVVTERYYGTPIILNKN